MVVVVARSFNQIRRGYLRVTLEALDFHSNRQLSTSSFGVTFRFHSRRWLSSQVPVQKHQPGFGNKFPVPIVWMMNRMQNQSTSTSSTDAGGGVTGSSTLEGTAGVVVGGSEGGNKKEEMDIGMEDQNVSMEEGEGDSNDDGVNVSILQGVSGVKVTSITTEGDMGTGSRGGDIASGTLGEKVRIISEGKVQIPQGSNIFYNPTQEFNRDISTVAIQTFIKSEGKNDVKIMEAMSASGIRAVRYAKEITGIKTIIANDYSASAVEMIRRNAERNSVENIVEPSYADACTKMYEQRNSPIIVDLDPYGTPTPFLDSAVQCVQEGGLLMVTATDMAVLAGGNHAESCFAKYGSMSLKSKACHEIALRIVAHTVQSTANRYGRAAIPLLSLSVDFYVRLFFKIIKSAKHAKQSVLKTSMIYQCTMCRSFTLQPLASIKKNHTSFAQGPPVPKKCENCDSSHHIAGPIWSGPLHNHEFIDKMTLELNETYSYLGTFERIKGMLGLVREELLYCPLFYEVSELCSIVKASSIPLIKMRSAIMNLGYEVSLSHTGPNTIKTNMPNNVLWDILRAWRREMNPNPIKEDTVGHRIMSRESTTKTIDFTIRADAKPLSQNMNLLRYQVNPERFWGPGSRDAFKSHEDGAPTKRELNQGKYKNKNKKKCHTDTSKEETN